MTEKTVSDSVFHGYRDDLDFNDDNDVGMYRNSELTQLTVRPHQRDNIVLFKYLFLVISYLLEVLLKPILVYCI